MKKLAMLVSIPFFIGILFCYHGTAFAEHTGPGVYNDEDLKKYETPDKTGGKTAPNAPNKISDEKTSEDRETQAKEYWCSRGAPIIRAISDAKDEIENINNQFTEDGENVLPDTVKKERRDSAMRKLREAESALSVVDEEAHAAGVPPGWIRCNF
jgi:hypothetical protein